MPNINARLSRYILVLFLVTGGLFAQDFKKQVIYQVITDRFVDGTTANDNPTQSSGLFDATKTNWHLYWGGDLTGIQQKLSYLKGMGVTAIWVSPPVDNINVNIPDDQGNPTSPYHGYSARDFKRIEEHYGDGANLWTEFDSLVAAAHSNGIKIIVDFAANHTSPEKNGEKGALYDSGTLIATYDNDPQGIFHHTSDLTDGDYQDRYKVQYYSLLSLADLNQENPTVDSYLKASLRQLQQHGVDAFRMDAVKHVTWGWEYSEVNSIFTGGPSFVFGEWMDGRDDSLYHDAYKFANTSGMSLLDYPLYYAITDVFAKDSPFTEIDKTLSAESHEFDFPNDLVTFIDNHDKPRLLSIKNNPTRLDEATVFLFTCRGIPVIYYGDEQYLHNDTVNGNNEKGGDPYNRPRMSAFNITTTGYKLVGKLAGLRQTNSALAYGSMQQRWINNDVYIYERKFFDDLVLTAINKSDTASYSISGLFTALPAAVYPDYLGGLMGGLSITVNEGHGNNPVTTFTLPPHTVAVWQSSAAATSPEAGSVGPTVGQTGMNVTIAGKGFGAAPGTVLFGSTPATIQSWSDTTVRFSVPQVSSGKYNIQLKTSAGAAANTLPFTVLTAKLIPVTFTVKNSIPTNFGDNIFLTGSTVELGNWGTTFDTAVGPMLTPNYPDWFINASVPAGITIQFKFIRIATNGDVTWEGGANHTYTVPTSGTGFVDVTWQK